MNGLSNIQISNFLRTHTKFFHGVFSSDNIDVKLRDLDKFSIICNFSKQDQQGSHFISIISFSNYVLYIDSLGLPCVMTHICNFLKSLKKPIYSNTKQIQGDYSKFCGFYCILYVFYFDEARNFRITFSNNLENNDKICVKYISDLLKNK